jgi:hypothetical protein
MVVDIEDAPDLVVAQEVIAFTTGLLFGGLFVLLRGLDQGAGNAMVLGDLDLDERIPAPALESLDVLALGDFPLADDENQSLGCACSGSSRGSTLAVPAVGHGSLLGCVFRAI